jgi:hypothetical protein
MPGRANHIHARICALYRNDEVSTTSLGLHFMKTKAIVATLLIAAAASADARFAWPYPRKAASPDESSQWIVINDYPWSHDAESEHRIPTRIVFNKTAAKGSHLPSDSRQSHLNKTPES